MALLVLGIDGGTFSVINPLIAHGELPNLASLIQKGIHGPLRSSLPPQSAPAWVSLVTGQNPGRHGVFDFWTRDLRQYDDTSAQLNQSTAFAGQTIWDYAGDAGLRVGVVSVPVTYPAWTVNGFLISGTLLAPNVNQRAAYPPELAERYGVELNFPDAYRYGASREEVMREGPAMMLRRKEVVLELLAERPCDFLMVVLGETDKAQHDFWHCLESDCSPDERERYGQAINEHYRVADQVLGEILAAFDQDILVAVVSDHGAGPYPRRAFRTNTWLHEQGWLALRHRSASLQSGLQAAIQQVKRFLPGRLQAMLRQRGNTHLLRVLRNHYTGLRDIDWKNTKAYRTQMQPPTEGIVVNLRGRQREGIVPPSEYEATVEEIAEKLKTLIDPETKAPIVAEVHLRDQIYSGPYIEERAPDLVLVLMPDYKGVWGSTLPVTGPVSATERDQYRGAHTMDGIFILSGPGIRRNALIEDASILDIAPTLLHAMGLPVPIHMDGRVLLNVFEHANATDVRYTEPVETTSRSTHYLSKDEEQEVIARLRGLGYLE